MHEVVRALSRILDRRKKDEADIRPARVVSRHRDGTLAYAPLDGTCPQRGVPQSHLTGQVVRDPGVLSFGVGAAGLPLLLDGGRVDFLWVERLDPDIFDAGSSLTVDVHGVGLGEDVQFEFLLPGTSEINEAITIEATRVISPQLVELDLAISVASGEVVAADLAYGRSND